jgi:hypothetical protein
MFSVSTADIETRWRPLTDDESDIALVRLRDAERRLRGLRPLLLAFYEGLADGQQKTDLAEAVRTACAEAVIRFLKNPDLVSNQQIGADGSVGIGFDTRGRGGVYISEEDLADIDDVVASGRPRVGSQVLVSSFPWRREDDVDMNDLPTP